MSVIKIKTAFQQQKKVKQLRQNLNLFFVSKHFDTFVSLKNKTSVIMSNVVAYTNDEISIEHRIIRDLDKQKEAVRLPVDVSVSSLTVDEIFDNLDKKLDAHYR